MMRNLGKLFLTLCLLTVGGGAVANAQIESVPGIQANIPFAFSVGDTKLPAGNYLIKANDENYGSKVLQLRSDNGHKSVLFNVQDVQTSSEDQVQTKTELVFDKIGDQYFLSQVWVAGVTYGSELPKSKMEKRLEDGGGHVEKQSVVGSLSRLKR